MQAAKMEAIGELVSGLAHDFNNILGIIHGSLETLELRIKDSTQRELVQLATLAAERGRDITRTLQAVARRRPQKAERGIVKPGADGAATASQTIGNAINRCRCRGRGSREQCHDRSRRIQ